MGTGSSGFRAWAQPADSLSESAGNSQPGPQYAKAACETGSDGSNARAQNGTGSEGSIAEQRGSGGFDPTSSFINQGTGNLASAQMGITSGTGSTGSIAGQEGDNSGFVYESGRVPSMPARGHMANTTGLTGEFSGSGLRTPSVTQTPLSTHLSGAGGLSSDPGGLPKADGSPSDPLTQDWGSDSINLCSLAFWEKEPLFPPFSFRKNSFYFNKTPFLSNWTNSQTPCINGVSRDPPCAQNFLKNPFSR